MTPAPAPATNVTFMLGQLMDRTECLPELRDDVSTLKADFRHLRDVFDAHSKKTDEELTRINKIASAEREKFAFLRGKWAGGAALLALLLHFLSYLWPKAH
jgi:hypothetical protein